MKYIFPLILLSGILFMAGCVSSGSATSDNRKRSGDEVLIDNPSLGLDVYIKRLSGVNVRGTGQSAYIDIRGGGTTFQSDPRPLFVIDGVQVGRDFSRVYRMVNMFNVRAVRVIKLSKATVLFGHEGSNGAIEILMKN